MIAHHVGLNTFAFRVFPRNKLKAWILRHLVESNGDADLMAKAIALHHDDENLNGVGSASKGAVGRESMISGRVCSESVGKYA